MSSVWSRIALSAALAAALAVWWPGQAAAATLVVDDDGLATAADCNATTVTPYTTIQSAVAVALPSDSILVCPGTYTEQVTVSTNNLILQSTSLLGATIKAPAAIVAPGAIVRVNGATGVTIDGFIISGPGGTPCSSLQYGVRVDGGGVATIKNNKIQSIRDNPFSGCQNGVGILVGRNFEGTTGTATIMNNVIEDHQKGGIVVDNAGSSATITGNTITGRGPTNVIAQNGIQISRGAAGSLSNNTVTNHFYLNNEPDCAGPGSFPVGACIANAAGVLLFRADAASFPNVGGIQSANTLRHNQTQVLFIK